MKERFCIDFPYLKFKDSAEEKLRILKNAGFQNVSIDGGGYGDFMPASEIPVFADICEKVGIKLINYHPYFMKNNLLWLDTPEKEDVIAQHIKAIYNCGKVGISSIIVHPTSGPNNLYVSGIGVESFKRMLESAENNNVTICLENLRTQKHNDFLYANIPSEYLGFCHDTGHEFAYNKGMDFPVRYADRMAYTHLHDNNGVDDQHKLPLTGEIDFERYAMFLNEINYTGPLSLEVTHVEKNYADIGYEAYVNKGFETLCKVFGE